jgi:hypothetical protein
MWLLAIMPAELGRGMPAAAGQVNRETLTRRSAAADGPQTNQTQPY